MQWKYILYRLISKTYKNISNWEINEPVSALNVFTKCSKHQPTTTVLYTNNLIQASYLDFTCYLWAVHAMLSTYVRI